MGSFKEIKRNFYFHTSVYLILSFVLGIAYLIGFWWTIDINIFPFIGLYDLIRCSASPFLILYILGLILYSCVIELHVQPHIEIFRCKLLSNENRTKRRLQYRLLSIIVLVIFIAVGIFLKISTLWLGGPLFIVIAWSYLHHRSRNNPEQKESPRALVILLFLLPFISYDIAHYKATTILDGKEYSYIVINDGGRESMYKFLGFVNEHYFFIDHKNKILLINNDKPNLKVYKYLKKGAHDNPDMGFN